MEEGYWRTVGREAQDFKPFPSGPCPPAARVRLGPPGGRCRAAPAWRGALCLQPPAPCSAAPLPLSLRVVTRFHDAMSLLPKRPLDVTLSSPSDSRADTSPARNEGTGVLKARGTQPAPGQRFGASLMERAGDTGAAGRALLQQRWHRSPKTDD